MIVIALICILSLGYLLFAWYCLEKFHNTGTNASSSAGFHPPVSILKPVCGLDPEMNENLRSFCDQDYPEFQVIFGLRDENDPAAPTIRKIIKDYPDRDITLVVDQSLHGNNYKVSNLINMYPHARHEILVIADDDMRVTGNYLNAVVVPLADNGTGVVTCLYSGSPGGGIMSALNAMFVNEWFLPSALISHALKNNNFCFGATMVIKRGILEQIGGLDALVDYLADDYMLGKLVAGHGYKIKLSHFIVKNIIQEPDFRSMLSHELRWARTMRTVQPLGYIFTFLTDTLMLAFLLAVTVFIETNLLIWPVVIICSVLLVRILFHLRVQTILDAHAAGTIWLVPARDFLTFFIRLMSYTGNRIEWKDKSFSVDNNGLIYSPAESIK